MKVLVLSENQFEVREIKNTLEELQEIVGGYIEIPYLSNVFYDNGIDVIINEEGKFIEDCKPEIAILDGETKQLLDIVMGNCIFASHDDEGETVGLTEEQIGVILEELKRVVRLTFASGENRIVRALMV